MVLYEVRWGYMSSGDSHIDDWLVQTVTLSRITAGCLPMGLSPQHKAFIWVGGPIKSSGGVHRVTSTVSRHLYLFIDKGLVHYLQLAAVMLNLAIDARTEPQAAVEMRQAGRLGPKPSTGSTIMAISGSLG